MSRRRYVFMREHPAEQRAILRRLNGQPDETIEDGRMVKAAINELEDLINSRQRRRRLPSERSAKGAQKSLFRRGTGRQ